MFYSQGHRQLFSTFQSISRLIKTVGDIRYNLGRISRLQPISTSFSLSEQSEGTMAVGQESSFSHWNMYGHTGGHQWALNNFRQLRRNHQKQGQSRFNYWKWAQLTPVCFKYLSVLFVIFVRIFRLSVVCTVSLEVSLWLSGWLPLLASQNTKKCAQSVSMHVFSFKRHAEEGLSNYVLKKGE
jgi:hypothetical protein